jgi:putative membrane protein
MASGSPAASATPVAAASGAVTDESFVQSASQAEAGRYALAVVAQKRAHGSAVRELANRIASDSSQFSRWLAAYAAKKHIAVSSQPKVRAAYQYSQLSGLSGAAFDRTFLQSISIDTSIALDSFKQQRSHAKDPALAGFIKRQIAQFESDLAAAHAQSG